MIQCSECKTMNSPELSICAKCSADLLPGATRTQKLSAIGGAVFFLILGAGTLIAAISLFRRLGTQESFGRPDGYFALIFFLVAVGSLFLAVNGFRSAIKSSSPDEKYFYRAKRHIEIDATQAEADFAEAIRLAPPGQSMGVIPKLKDIVYRLERAMFYEKTGKFEQAIADYGKVISLSSEHPPYYYQRGLNHEKLGHTKEARADFENALNLMSKNSDTWRSAKPIGIPEVKAAIQRVSIK